MTLRKRLAYSISIWVSRKTSDGMVSCFSVPLWLFFVIGLICLINLIAWGCIGIYEAVGVIAS